jgi:hypothetical protein
VSARYMAAGATVSSRCLWSCEQSHGHYRRKEENVRSPNYEAHHCTFIISVPCLSQCIRKPLEELQLFRMLSKLVLRMPLNRHDEAFVVALEPFDGVVVGISRRNLQTRSNLVCGLMMPGIYPPGTRTRNFGQQCVRLNRHLVSRSSRVRVFRIMPRCRCRCTRSR